MSNQIPLPFGSFDRFNFEIFNAGPNRQAVDYLQQVISSTNGGYVYLWGEQGTGKSHLLQAACTQAAAGGHKVIYIPLQQRQQIAPELLQGVESLELVCIDDVDQIAGDAAWEIAIFNLYNQLSANHNQLVISAQSSPQGLAIRLPDLKSRLAAGVTWHLSELNEQERLQALQQRAKMRGFELPDEVIDYLSRRVARDMHSLFDWLDRLDQATLASKKKLTVPFVRELLNKID